GVALGWVGARLVLVSAGRGWIGPHWQQLFVLALAALSYALAIPLGGSGFIAAWTAGCAMGLALRDRLPGSREFPEDMASVLTILSFLLFGAVYLGPSLSNASWAIVGYALCSLTIIRMAPVALAMVGTGLAPPSVAYVGWFGPRGLASIVFADLVVEHGLPGVPLIATIVNITVGLSVLAHGMSSWAGSERYAAWCARRLSADPDAPRGRPVSHPPAP